MQHTIFTSEKLDKLDELIDAVNNFIINDTKYYLSNTVTMSDAQGDITSNPETVTRTSNGNFEQALLSNRTFPFFPPAMNLGIGQGIARLYLCHRLYLCLQQRKSSQTRGQEARGKNRTQH